MTEAHKIETLTEALWNALNQLNMEGGVVAKHAPNVFECHEQAKAIILEALKKADNGEGWA